MRWKLKSGDHLETIELIQIEGDSYTFKVGNKVVTLKDPKNFAYSISANGLKLNLETWNKDKWRASRGAKIFSLEPLSESASGTSGSQEVKTQMPGRILKVLVYEGQEVEPQQTLLIMEAMKMENEIRATSKQTIAKVHVKAGDSVESGALLISFQ